MKTPRYRTPPAQRHVRRRPALRNLRVDPIGAGALLIAVIGLVVEVLRLHDEGSVK